MSIDEEKLKALWSQQPASEDDQVALGKILKKSSQVTASKDVAGIFIGWLWVIFLGFGASAYSAKRRLHIHKQARQLSTSHNNKKHTQHYSRRQQ